jgi:hypothetical protein
MEYQDEGSDEHSYLEHLIKELNDKCEQPCYADRRAEAMLNRAGDNDYELENELQFALDEITSNENS